MPHPAYSKQGPRDERLLCLSPGRKQERNSLYLEVYHLVIEQHRAMLEQDKKRVLLLIIHKLDEWVQHE